MKRIAFAVMNAALVACSSTGEEPGSETTSADLSSSSTTLAAGQHRPREMVVDATHVYWTTYPPSGDRPPFERRNDVLRVAKSGGPVEALATNQRGLVGLAVDRTHVYWLAQTGECTAGAPTGVARRLAKAGGAVESIASGLPCGSPSANTQAVVDDQRLYWSGDDGIRAVPKEGGTPALIAEAGPNPNASTRATVLLVQDATTLFWGDSYGPLWAQRKDGGGKVKLLEASPWHAAVDASSLYYARDGKIMRVGKAGGAAVELGPSGGRGEDAIAVDGGFVFWTDVVDDQLRRMPVGGDLGAETLVAGERAYSIVTDASGTYYASYGRELDGMVPDYVARSGSIRRRPSR